jgi:hypothetical protein
MKALIILFCSVLLFGCSSKKTKTGEFTDFGNNDTQVEDISQYTDKLAKEKIEISKTVDQNQDFIVNFKTYEPDGVGKATFKAKSIKEIAEVDGRTAEDGKKLILIEIAVQGNTQNKGMPSTFNQIGEKPSPQFVLIDKAKNESFTETNYFSTAYTVFKKLFELDKITLDHDQWVNTALVFEIDKNLTPDLAFRFTNNLTKTEFYDIKE